MWTSYLAMGDSTTSGVGDAVDDLECRSWADWVAEALRSLEPALEYRNVARRGATAASVIQIQVPELDAIAPDFVSVTVGGNDARKREWTAEAFEESTIGLYKAELICRQGPWRTPEQVEIATLECIDWRNNRRLHTEIGDIPPAEVEAIYYAGKELMDTAMTGN